jgi:membrane-bound metal-dependent hydrolase YbcI (DUF457 family)
MPSPLGHALVGIAAGCAILPSRVGRMAVFASVGMAADLDLLLPIAHRGPAHSVTAAVVVAVATLAVLLITRPVPADSVRIALAMGAAYLTHVLLDWLGADGGPPSGIMALWPFSSHYYVSGLDVFSGLERRYWLSGFWRQNLISVVREIIILAPIAVMVIVLSKRGDRHPPAEVE